MVLLNVIKLTGILEKLTGLIGKKRIEPICFTTRWGIHTYGVHFPIDVLILDGNNRVVNMVARLQPNRLFFWNPKYATVIELPEGKIKEFRIRSGDIIKIKSTTPARR
jgi:uncharacterized membrane protein (UPF0127 family)